MAYTIDEIRDMVSAACETCGVKLSHPVRFNSRLKTTLGRVVSHICYDYVTADRIEFNENFIKTATADQVRDTVLHECGHYIVIQRTHELHHHDATFKAVCAELGLSSNAAKAAVDLDESNTPAPPKYEVICPKCGVIDGYYRMCKTLKVIDFCTCGKCGSGNLTYKQNY